MTWGLQVIEIARFLNMCVFQNTHCSKLNKIKDLVVLHIFPLTEARTCVRPPRGVGQIQLNKGY
jgi:hypothetical protein